MVTFSYTIDETEGQSQGESVVDLGFTLNSNSCPQMHMNDI